MTSDSKKYDDECDYNYLIAYLSGTIKQTFYWHQQTRVESEHSALGDFYQSLDKKRDKLSEVLQGYDVQILYQVSNKPEIDYESCAVVMDYLRTCRDYMYDVCENCKKKDVELLIIKIIELISHTIYRLKLK